MSHRKKLRGFISQFYMHIEGLYFTVYGTESGNIELNTV